MHRFFISNYLYKNEQNYSHQNILSTDISAGIWKQLFLAISYEGTFEKQNTWSRILLDLTTRF
jgi:hypothetical protein